MPRTRKGGKFFHQLAPRGRGGPKGQKMLGVVGSASDETSELTIQDFLAFLQRIKIDPSRVRLPRNFITFTN